MKILYAGFYPPPYSGGVEFTRGYTERLADRGHEVILYDMIGGRKAYYHRYVAAHSRCQNKFLRLAMLPFQALWLWYGPLRHEIREFLQGVSRRPGLWEGRNQYMMIAQMSFDLFFLAKRHRPDLIAISHAYPRALSAYLVGKNLNISTSLVEHTSSFTMPEYMPWRPFILHMCSMYTDINTISQYASRVMKEAGVVRDIPVIYQGVDVDFFAPARMDQAVAATYGIEPTDILILYVGWLIERKGVMTLLEALRRLGATARVRACLVGPDHGLYSTIKESIAKEPLSSFVSVHRDIPYDDLAVLYARADIFVFPTQTGDEGFGRVGVEAMASGTPVIGARIAAIPEIILDGECGLLFEPGNSEDIYAKILLLLNDPEYRQRLANGALVRARDQFDWRHAVIRYERHLESVLRRGQELGE